MDVSIPVLPHLPAAEVWRESTQSAGLQRSPRLQVLDDALETYETSFRRYSAISQRYYRALGARYDDPDQPMTAQCVAARELAESAYSRAVHDFESVEIAFSAWINSRDASLALPLARQMDMLLSTGKSRLDLRFAQSQPAQPRPAPVKGPKLTLKLNRKDRPR